MATSAAKQCEGERQPSAGGNDETRDEPQSQPQAPGAEALTTTSEDKMQTLTQLLMSMNQVLNQQAQTQAQQAQALDQKLDQQAQTLDQKLDQNSSPPAAVQGGCSLGAAPPADVTAALAPANPIAA